MWIILEFKFLVGFVEARFLKSIFRFLLTQLMYSLSRCRIFYISSEIKVVYLKIFFITIHKVIEFIKTKKRSNVVFAENPLK